MKAIAWLGLTCIALAACRGGPRPLRVGSKNFSESVLLGEILAQQLERQGQPVDRRPNLGGTFVCHHAIVAGELDLYPEYTGTAWTAILRHAPVADAAGVRAAVASEYEKRWDLHWSAPLGFDNSFALVMRADVARRLGIRAISDLATHPELRPGFGYEFAERQDGYPGLSKIYGLRFRQAPVQMDLGLLYPALESGKVDVVAGNSTDGLIEAIGGTVLQDDRRYFPPYEAAYVVRGSVWRERPQVRKALDSLAGRLNVETMRRLNALIDREKQRPEDIARAFLDGPDLQRSTAAAKER